MNFASDNTGPVHPAVMQALADANTGYTPSYGADPLMEEATARLRDIFEAPEAAVYLVATGTAANCLGLACLTPAPRPRISTRTNATGRSSTPAAPSSPSSGPPTR